MKAVGLFPWLLGIAACVSVGEARRDKQAGARLGDAPFNHPVKAEPEAKILVNQVGYFTNLAKIATLRSDAKQQLDWKLFAGDGHEAAYGKSQPAGLDVPSGDQVHIIDFSAFKGTGRGYILAVGSERSRPFEIGTGIYHKLKYDALSYYYHNRSGIEIAVRIEAAGEPAPPFLGLPVEQQVPPRSARRGVGWPQFGPARSHHQGRQPIGLCCRKVFRRQHRIVVDERDRDQLERALGLGPLLPRREGPGGQGR